MNFRLLPSRKSCSAARQKGFFLKSLKVVTLFMCLSTCLQVGSANAEQVFNLHLQWFNQIQPAGFHVPVALKSEADVSELIHRLVRRDDYSEILNIVAGAAAGLLLIVGMIGIWTVSLQRQVRIRTAELKTEREAREKAEAVNRDKSDLIATMNHEMRTPLNAVVGFSQLLSMGLKGPINDDQAEIISAIRSSGEHLLELVTGFLDLSKIESGNYQFVEVRINTGKILQEVITVFDDAVRQSSVRLSAELPPYLPNLLGDQLVFKQIFVNLLSNAIKFTPGDGEVHLLAHVSDKSELVVEVRDTGIGIPQKSIDTALAKFGQVGQVDQVDQAGQRSGLRVSWAKVQEPSSLSPGNA
jgi:signal transduction histidine kinase